MLERNQIFMFLCSTTSNNRKNKRNIYTQMFLRVQALALSLSLVFVFRLVLFSLSQPDISFSSSVLDILDLV